MTRGVPVEYSRIVSNNISSVHSTPDLSSSASSSTAQHATPIHLHVDRAVHRFHRTYYYCCSISGEIS